MSSDNSTWSPLTLKMIDDVFEAMWNQTGVFAPRPAAPNIDEGDHVYWCACREVCVSEKWNQGRVCTACGWILHYVGTKDAVRAEIRTRFPDQLDKLSQEP